MGTSPFTDLYDRGPPPLIVLPPSASIPPDVATLIKQRGEVIVMLRKNLERAQQRMREGANKHRRHVEFEVGDRVLLKLQLLYRQHSVARPLSAKISRRYYGPFEILERIGPIAYRLQLSKGSRVHNVFHVSLLRPFIEEMSEVTAELPEQFAWGRPVSYPARILERRTVIRDGTAIGEGLVAWADDAGSSPSWEPIAMIARRFPNLLLEDKEPLIGGRCYERGRAARWERYKRPRRGIRLSGD